MKERVRTLTLGLRKQICVIVRDRQAARGGATPFTTNRRSICCARFDAEYIIRLLAFNHHHHFILFAAARLSLPQTDRNHDHDDLEHTT